MTLSSTVEPLPEIPAAKIDDEGRLVRVGNIINRCEVAGELCYYTFVCDMTALELGLDGQEELARTDPEELLNHYIHLLEGTERDGFPGLDQPSFSNLAIRTVTQTLSNSEFMTHHNQRAVQLRRMQTFLIRLRQYEQNIGVSLRG